MNSDQSHTFSLSIEELEFLKRMFGNDEFFGRLLGRARAGSGHKVFIEFRRSEAETLRARLTEELARTGFDGSYQTTPHGRLLEELIDRFLAR